MLKTGRKVVLPLYGLGIMKGIRREKIAGAKETYYVIKIGRMKVLIPTKRAERSGLREVINKEEVPLLLEKLQRRPSNKRKKRMEEYEEIRKKAERGSAFQTVEALGELAQLSQRKTLNSKEKNLFNSLKETLIDELVWVQKMPKKKVKRIVDEALKKK